MTANTTPRRVRTAPNPLAEDLNEFRAAAPALMVIFGATGDLSGRKLLPALYNLSRNRLLPAGFALVGAALDDIPEVQFRNLAAQHIREHSRTQPVDEPTLQAFIDELYYLPIDFGQPEGFQRLAEKLAELDAARHTGGNVVFYCATPPSTYHVLSEQLRQAGLNHGNGYRRIIVEKPFGRDLRSAQDLSKVLRRAFPEDSLFRIDHYLGKETVQNILAFRFANSIFEPVWNSQHVDHVQITVSEPLGVEQRGDYYDRVGALRDIVQNHALQLLTLVAMEPPVALEAGAVRDEKVKVLRAIRPLSPDEVGIQTVRAQYTEGWVMGEKVPAYRQEPKVAPDSQTETYAALRCMIDNWRWAGTPFYIRTGKRLPKQVTEIRVQFKRPPHLTFGRTATRDLEPNAITLRIQPEEGISLRFGAKVPTAGLTIRSVNMDFLYASSFLIDAPDAYERLLVDCMLGDPTLFTRSDEVEAAWELIDCIEEVWQQGEPPLETYAAGTWGPEGADRLIEKDGRKWHRP
ncbi:MAG TPA: glucose-6-phosphate dehydrogenase [Candidatus Dormibacteraeota bacterium]